MPKSLLLIIVLAVLGVVVVISFVGSTYSKLAGVPRELDMKELAPIAESEPSPEYWALLLVGLDTESLEEQALSVRTDVIMVVTAHAQTKQVRLLSIPRDTYVEIPARGFDKINHAFTFGGGAKNDTGIWLTMQTVSLFLGVGHIDHYAILDMESVPRIVDCIGGVRIGDAVLSGQQALAYARWRGDGRGDIGRIPRQQQLLLSIVERLMETAPSPTQAINLVQTLISEVRTDVGLGQAKDYASLFAGLRPELIEMFIVPGKAIYKNGISYWEADLESLAPMVRHIFYMPEPSENLGGDG